MAKSPPGRIWLFSILALIPVLGLCFIALRREVQKPIGLSTNQAREAPPAEIPIRVNPTVELFSVIYRLADINQYNEMELPRYVEEVEEYFGGFRNHRAVEVAKELNGSHAINGNAPMDLAVRLTPPPELELRTTVPLALGDMDTRWDDEILPALIEAAREFAVDTDFMAFFQAHDPFFRRAVGSLSSTLAETDPLPWFQEFFGGMPESYVLILGLLNGTCNYGSRVTLPDGTMEFISMLGAIEPDGDGVPQYARSRFLPTIVHEFNHSYINPLVDRHTEVLQTSGEPIFAHLQDGMHNWGYNHWYVMYYEYLVRASTVRFLEAHEGAPAAQRRARQDERDGFPGLGQLADLLKEYEGRRVQYRDLDDFMPEIVEFFQRMEEEMGVSPPSPPMT